jgi:hypothetical protein
MSGENSTSDEVTSLLSELKLRERIEESLAPAYEREISPAAVRSHVTKLIVRSYIGFVCVSGLFIILGGTWATTDRINDLMEIMKTSFLPVVTFVIGHYFGSKSE